MGKGLLWIAGGIVLAGAAAGVLALRLTEPPKMEVVDFSDAQLAAKYNAEAGLCPWRNPEADLKAFFPGATTTHEETLVLSRYRSETEQKLGRKPTGEENALPIHRVLKGNEPLGTVIARRVKGDSGLIELVLAVGLDGKIKAAKIQRLRETDAVAKTLRSESFLKLFRERDSSQNCAVCTNFTGPEAAMRPGGALLDAAHSALVLYEIGESHKKTPTGSGSNH